MNVIIKKSYAEGNVNSPPSKSISHRALISGAFSEGSVVRNIAFSKDIEATLGCLEKLGAFVYKEDGYIRIGGLDVNKIVDGTVIDCNESGSTLRFLLPICMLADKAVTLEGKGRLMERPLSVYEEICRKDGIFLSKGSTSVSVKGRLSGGHYFVRGDISSQFITGLLFALPLLEGDSTLTVTGKFESASYIDLTLSVLSEFGIRIDRKDNVFYIKGGQKYISADYTVEGDCSNSAFLEGFNLLGGNVCVKGLCDSTLQGDSVYRVIYPKIKASGGTYDISDCPDLGPVLFALAAYYGGAVFEGTARLRIKESDRAKAMADELEKFGIAVEIYDNSVVIRKGELKAPQHPLCGHNDHRIVMALSLLCSVTGGIIEGAEAVSKSYPDYFEVIKDLGIDLEIQG